MKRLAAVLAVLLVSACQPVILVATPTPTFTPDVTNTPFIITATPYPTLTLASTPDPTPTQKRPTVTPIFDSSDSINTPYFCGWFESMVLTGGTRNFERCVFYSYGEFTAPVTTHVANSRQISAPQGFKAVYTKATDVFCSGQPVGRVICDFNLSYYDGKIGYSNYVYLNKNQNHYIKIYWSAVLTDNEQEYSPSALNLEVKFGNKTVTTPLDFARAGVRLIGVGQQTWVFRTEQDGRYDFSVQWHVPYAVFDSNSSAQISAIKVFAADPFYHENKDAQVVLVRP